MANPMMLFENVFDDADGTLTATSEATDFDVENINNWRIGTPYRWKATDTTSPQYLTMDLGLNNAKRPDTAIIAGSNLVEAAPNDGYTFQYETTAGSGWNDLHTETVATSNVVEVQTFSAFSARSFRLRIQDTAGMDAIPQIGVVTLGRRLEFDEGTPESLDPFGWSAVTDDAKQLGTPLGSNTLYKMKSFGIRWPDPGLTRDSFFQPASGLTFDGDFVDHAIKGVTPFWFSWDLDDTVDPGPYLCRSRAVSSPFLGSYKRRTLSARFDAFSEVG